MPEASSPSPDANGALLAGGPGAGVALPSSEPAALEGAGHELARDGAGLDQAPASWAPERVGLVTGELPVTRELSPHQPPPDGEQASGGHPEGPRRRHRRHSAGRQIVEWLAVAAVALVVAVLLRSFVVQTFYVPSGSMLPTLQIGDRIIVDKLHGPIHRYDIIVFRRTPQDTTTTDADLVKRVIGLPGETLWSKGDTIYANGKPLDESWLPRTSGPGALERLCPQASYGIPVTHVPAGEYFVMGDCRGNSEDSRAWGFVPSSYIVGKVFVVIWRHNHPWLHWF